MTLALSRDGCGKPCTKWSVMGLGWGRDVAFRLDGKVAVTDNVKKKVVLYGNQGEIIADTSHQGVTLTDPCGIAYYQPQNVFLVADDLGGVVLLNAYDLKLVQILRMPGVVRPTAVSIIDNNVLVVADWFPGKICVYKTDSRGRKWSLWNTLNQYEEKKTIKNLKRQVYEEKVSIKNFTCLVYLSTSPPDTIFTCQGHHLLKFNIDGQLKFSLHIKDSADLGQCIQHWGNLLVVDSKLPDWPSRLVWCADDGTQTALISWSRDDITRYGCMMSVGINGPQLVIIGSKGICCYHLI